MKKISMLAVICLLFLSGCGQAIGVQSQASEAGQAAGVQSQASETGQAAGVQSQASETGQAAGVQSQTSESVQVAGEQLQTSQLAGFIEERAAYLAERLPEIMQNADETFIPAGNEPSSRACTSLMISA